jgi:hypothetical protein
MGLTIDQVSLAPFLSAVTSPLVDLISSSLILAASDVKTFFLTCSSGIVRFDSTK